MMPSATASGFKGLHPLREFFRPFRGWQGLVVSQGGFTFRLAKEVPFLQLTWHPWEGNWISFPRRPSPPTRARAQRKRPFHCATFVFRGYAPDRVRRSEKSKERSVTLWFSRGMCQKNLGVPANSGPLFWVSRNKLIPLTK